MSVFINNHAFGLIPRMPLAAAGTETVGCAPGLICSKVKVYSKSTLAKKAGSTSSSIC